EVPAAAAAGVPYRLGQLALQLVVEAVLRLPGRSQPLRTHLVAFRDRIGDVADLRFDHEHHGVVAQSGIRAQQEEQVGHVGDGDPAMRTDALAVPAVDQVLAVLPLDLDVGVGVGDVEAGGVHDHVDLVFGAVRGDDPVAHNAGDAIRDQFGLRVRDSAI